MPCIQLPIDSSNRPIIESGISAPSSLLPAGASRPPIYWIKALADTGCTNTSVHSATAIASGLKILGKAPGQINTAAGPVNCNVYHGDLFVKVPMQNGTVFEYPFRDRGIIELACKIPDVEALLGMDMFSLGTLHINGITRTAMWCW